MDNFLDNKVIKNNKNNFRLYSYNDNFRLYVPKELKNKRIIIDNDLNVIIDNDNGVPVNNQCFISIKKMGDKKIELLRNKIELLKIK